MSIIELLKRQDFSENTPLNKIYIQFQEFLNELRNKKLPERIIESINQDITELNATTLAGNELKKLLKKKQTENLKLVEKELKIVPKNYYRNLWLALGMSAFGLPIGVILGLIIKNMGLLGIGLPIGMGIGVLVGSAMDKKALKEGRQLNMEIK